MKGRSAQMFRATIFLTIAAVAALPLFAQSTTATIRGKVVNQNGNAISGAEINAVSTTSGYVQTVKATGDGSYVLGGLTPGEYNLVVAASGYEPRNETIVVRVGQRLDMNLMLSPTAVVSESITVVGNQLIETKTSEIATNVTSQQIENLPQPERNFLNFAQLAPGIRMSQDPQRKTIAGDAQDAERTNVYIDGISQKNDILQGGLAGQDSSRGNPFPQNAVQEFRVITQNYSAQYGQASSAIITAVTKSGTNQLQGQAFVYYQPKAWVSEQPKGFQYSTLTTNDSYKRYQPGFSLGGPIIKDKLHFFGSYEGDQQHATTPVTLGNQSYSSQFGQYVGTFSSPFRSNLGFGKLSWQPASDQLVDFTGSIRREHEVRDFGGQTSYESATDLRNETSSLAVHHQWNSDRTFNQLALSYSNYAWNPTPLNPGTVGSNYEGVIRIGGNSTLQKFFQQRIELRDDYNLATFKLAGDHAVQVGGNVDKMHYFVDKSLFGNPQYNYRTDPANGLTFAQPYEAQYGFGDPTLSTNNTEWGIYGQDNWTVNQHLQLNLGLRWDYESQMLNYGYVTPSNIVQGLKGKVDPGYFSTGSERKPFRNEYQPRFGFSYDVKGDARTVVFGGWGRYYDRVFLNSTLDELYRLQFPVYRLEFSPTGAPRNGAPTIKWDPSYGTAAGLDQLIKSGITSPEIFLMWNDTKPPYSNQYNLGVRQTLGNWVGSLMYNGVRGYRGFTWLSATGICCSALVPGYGNVIISDPKGKEYWYNAVALQLTRPYTSQSRWGGTLTWTHAKAEQNGNDLFSLDYPTAATYPKHEVPGSEHDRIVASAIFGLPGDFRLSTLLSFGSGAATPVLDFSKGFDLNARLQTQPFKDSIYPPKSGGFADRNVDFRVEKDISITHGARLTVVGEMFNAFNWTTYGCLNNFIPPEGNPTFGQPTCTTNLGRREQLGLKMSF